jgi:signal transduction histidine kinase
LENSIINLVSNAIKYSVKGTVEITAFREDDLCVVKIKDEGIGMSESYQKHLFQTFSQEVVGTSRPYEGVGLGLALAKKYMYNINGSISIQSKQGVGTTVTLKLPLAK